MELKHERKMRQTADQGNTVSNKRMDKGTREINQWGHCFEQG